MSLQKFHEEFIDSIIEDLIPKVDRRIDLFLQIRKIKEALDFEKTCAQDHPFYKIRACINQPDVRFNGLDRVDQTSRFSVGNVRRYVIQSIENILYKQAKELEYPVKYLKWDTQALQQGLPTVGNRKQFKSNGMIIEADIRPWELPPKTHTIYNRELCVIEQINPITEEIELFATVSVDIDLKDELLHRDLDLGQVRDDFLTQEEQQDHIDQLKEEAEVSARRRAALLARKHLEKVHRNARLIFNRCDNRIITNRFYYLDMLTSQAAAKRYINLTPAETEKLANENIIDLISRGLCDVATACALTEIEKSIATHFAYHKLIQQGMVFIQEVKGITKERANFLMLPPIINLINNGFMTFQEAKKLPLELKPILINPGYFAYFKRQKNNWAQFLDLTPPECELIKNPGVMQLLANDVITIADTKILTPEDLKQINQPEVLKILMANCVSLKNLDLITDKLIARTNADPKLISWLRAKLTTPAKVNELDSISLYMEVFAARLFNLHVNKPTPINNDFDSFEAVKNDMLDLFQHEHFASIDFENLVLEEILYQVSVYLRKACKKADEHSANYYDRLIDTITQDMDKPEFDYQDTLNNLLMQAECIRQEISRQKYKVKDKNEEKQWFLFRLPKRVKYDNQTSLDNVVYHCNSILSLSVLPLSSYQLQHKRKPIRL